MPTKGRKWVLSAELKEFFSGCDYLVANFEGTLYKDRPVFLAQNHDEAFLQDLAKIKDPSKIILSVANNHSADYGYDLFQKTCQRLEEIGFQVIGSRKKSQLIISEKINLAAATQWSNQHHGYLSFLEDADQLLAPDKLNLLFPHWGYEMDLYPRKDWVQLAKKLSTDWDCIVGHHSHVPGPVTTVPSPEGAKLVAYSLGDSSTAISLDSYRHGIALKVDIDLGHSSEEKAKILSAEWEFTKLKLEEDKSYTLEPCKICRIL